jgi:hypothetical protein
MTVNNPFLNSGLQAAREHLSHDEMEAALRKALPNRFRSGGVCFTDADIDALHEAFDLIRDLNLTYEEAFGIDMLCGIVPILWKILHVQLAFLWHFRWQAGDPNGFKVYDLHRRKAAGENIGLDGFWNCCPWLPAWEKKHGRLRDDSNQLTNSIGTSPDKNACN